LPKSRLRLRDPFGPSGRSTQLSKRSRVE